MSSKEQGHHQSQLPENDMSKRELVAEFLADEAIFFDPPAVFDGALIGVATTAGGETVAAYDYDKIIEGLMKDGDMSRDEAVEYYEFNTASAYLGPYTPVIINRISEE